MSIKLFHKDDPAALAYDADRLTPRDNDKNLLPSGFLTLVKIASAALTRTTGGANALAKDLGTETPMLYVIFGD